MIQVINGVEIEMSAEEQASFEVGRESARVSLETDFKTSGGSLIRDDQIEAGLKALGFTPAQISAFLQALKAQ